MGTNPTSAENPKLAAVRTLPLHEYLGVWGLEARDGRSRLRVPVTEHTANPAGVLHGGVVYALCDVAAYAALLSVLDPSQEAATHDIHVSVMQPARKGDTVSITSRLVRRGKRLAFLESEAAVGDEVIATASITKSILTPG